MFVSSALTGDKGAVLRKLRCAPGGAFAPG